MGTLLDALRSPRLPLQKASFGVDGTHAAGQRLAEKRARSNSRLAAQKAEGRAPATNCTHLLPLTRSLQTQGGPKGTAPG